MKRKMCVWLIDFWLSIIMMMVIIIMVFIYYSRQQ